MEYREDKKYKKPAEILAVQEQESRDDFFSDDVSVLSE